MPKYGHLLYDPLLKIGYVLSFRTGGQLLLWPVISSAVTFPETSSPNLRTSDPVHFESDTLQVANRLISVLRRIENNRIEGVPRQNRPNIPRHGAGRQ